MTPTASDLNQCLLHIIQGASGLPRITLYPQERMQLAGSAFQEAPLLVDAVCKAVEDDPDLFADVPLDPAALRAGQDRARMYLGMSASLDRLARHAHDMYLFEQSRATSQAMDVVRYGRCQLEGPYQTRRHQRLEDALRVPETILAVRTDNARGRRPSRRADRQPRPRARFTASDFVQRVCVATVARKAAQEKVRPEEEAETIVAAVPIAAAREAPREGRVAGEIEAMAPTVAEGRRAAQRAGARGEAEGTRGRPEGGALPGP